MFIYRIAYVRSIDEPANVYFTAWVRVDGLDEIQSKLEAVNPPDGESPAGVLPTIVGIDRKKLFGMDSLDEE